jgi:hypothetical protein
MIHPGNELVSSPTGVSRLNLGPSVLLAEPCPSPTVASFEEWMSTLKSNKLRTRGQNSLNHRLVKVYLSHDFSPLLGALPIHSHLSCPSMSPFQWSQCSRHYSAAPMAREQDAPRLEICGNAGRRHCSSRHLWIGYPQDTAAQCLTFSTHLATPTMGNCTRRRNV